VPSSPEDYESYNPAFNCHFGLDERGIITKHTHREETSAFNRIFMNILDPEILISSTGIQISLSGKHVYFNTTF
jgi:hypothetical protein